MSLVYARDRERKRQRQMLEDPLEQQMGAVPNIDTFMVEAFSK